MLLVRRRLFEWWGKEGLWWIDRWMKGVELLNRMKFVLECFGGISWLVSCFHVMVHFWFGNLGRGSAYATFIFLVPFKLKSLRVVADELRMDTTTSSYSSPPNELLRKLGGIVESPGTKLISGRM
jgi:hypothetical protein